VNFPVESRFKVWCPLGELRRRIARLRPVSLLLLGCVLSIFAIVFPFCHTETTRADFFVIDNYPAYSAYSVYFWSFKFSEKLYKGVDAVMFEYRLEGGIFSYITDSIDAAVSPAVYFNVYWFSSRAPSYWTPTPSWALIAMFVAQVSVLVAGLGSIFVRRQMVKLVTVGSGAATVGLMLYSSVNPCWQYHGSLQLGFWLACLAEVLFVVNFVSEAWSKRQRVHSSRAAVKGELCEKAKV
jgi:hypothetical protein